MFLAVLLIAFINSVSFAQMHDHMAMGNTKSENIKVLGNCDLCKVRIEKAAKIDGVSKAEWNKDTKILVTVYDPSKVTGEAIQKKVAAAGYDTEKFKGDDKAYSKLDPCCQYARKK